MSHFTNPAFCQKSEYYPRTISTAHYDVNNRSQRKQSESCSVSENIWTSSQSMQLKLQCKQRELQEKIQQRKLPPKPGPKPSFHINDSSKNELNVSGYALVPLDEIPRTKRDNYAILPLTDAYMMQNNSNRLTKSQDNLDCIFPASVYEEEDSFTSLPTFTSQQNNQKLISAFSTDFINKSMILLDQNSMQRYAIVPTDDDEDVVDSNHEIIEMHNGRAHRYAVIPTDDDETCIDEKTETSMNGINRNENLSMPLDMRAVNLFQKKLKAPIKAKPFIMKGSYISNQQIQPKTNDVSNTQAQLLLHCNETSIEGHGAPTKNPIATQKLHELLSTPRKCKPERLQRHGSYHTIIQKSPNQFQLQELYSPHKSTTKLIPQKLQYEDNKVNSQATEQRTTAIISPRLHQQTVYNETTLCPDKPLPHESFQKVESATATIGIISLMLILTGVLNSGLCLYMITDVSLEMEIYESIFLKS